MPDTPERDPVWERRIVEKLALESLAEQRRRRRWGIFFKILGFAYLTFLIVALGDWGYTAEKPACALPLVHDVRGIAAQRYDTKPGSVYLIRPDQHVAARWRRFDAAKILAAVARATCRQ